MKLGCLLVLCAVATALYTEDDGVTILTAANFQSAVIESEGLFAVEFYAPWCGHCKSLVPEWIKFGKAMKGQKHLLGFASLLHLTFAICRYRYCWRGRGRHDRTQHRG